LGFRPLDLALGVGTFIIAIGAAGLAAAVMAALVGLAPDEVAGNTGALARAEGTVWLALMLPFLVIVGPAAEELFFRGLTLRALERRFGLVVAVVGSTLLFVAAHYGGAGAAQTAVLLSAIAGAGLTFAVVTVQVGRLWPAIIGHMLFNGVAAARALGALDRLGAS
ncbi:MAG: CPBP family intramembrane glutamic endopeptidase, partial [Actinomycetota bacterium]